MTRGLMQAGSVEVDGKEFNEHVDLSKRHICNSSSPQIPHV